MVKIDEHGKMLLFTFNLLFSCICICNFNLLHETRLSEYLFHYIGTLSEKIKKMLAQIIKFTYENLFLKCEY